jgi:RimJ/RimL family protein N-acetyltransferase
MLSAERKSCALAIGRDFWGRSVATAALTTFLRDIPLRPLRAHVVRSNDGSRRVLERCGLSIVGEDRFPAPMGGEAAEEWILRLE